MQTLETIAAGIANCRLCRDGSGPNRLPHEPRPIFQLSGTAKLFICSQAPGARAHSSGIPFLDPSGVRLRDWMGVTEAEFYNADKIAIVPMGFCFPGYDKNGGDLPPRPECAKHWRSLLFEALPQTPELILLVGSHAQRWHLGAGIKPALSTTLEDWRALANNPHRPCYLPLPHPSWRNTGWLKKNPWFGEEVLPSLRQKVRDLIEG